MNATSCNYITLCYPIRLPPPPQVSVIPDHRPFSLVRYVLSMSVLGPIARDTPDMVLFFQKYFAYLCRDDLISLTYIPLEA